MGSPFASLSVSDPIPLPFDEGAWIRVRKLTGRELEKTRASHRVGFASGDSRLWPVTLKRALEHGATDPEVRQAIRDPLTGYDRYALARAGLHEWSYPQSLKPVTTKSTVEGQPDTVYDAIDDLGDDEVDFCALEVLKRAKPSLFIETAEQDVADTKKG